MVAYTGNVKLIYEFLGLLTVFISLRYGAVGLGFNDILWLTKVIDIMDGNYSEQFSGS